MATFNKSKDYSNLIKEVSKANKRIKNIETRYGEESWAIKGLYNKIDSDLVKGVNKRGYIRVNKSMSNVQLKAIEKATSEFLASKTSTLGGIKSTVKDVKNSLKATYGDMTHPISTRDINKLYDLVEDKDKRVLTEQIGASNLWATLIQAKDQKLDFNKFYDLIENRSDVGLKEKEDIEFLEDIYNNYIK